MKGGISSGAPICGMTSQDSLVIERISFSWRDSITRPSALNIKRFELKLKRARQDLDKNSFESKG
jgi:hypothetical protein